MAQRYLWRLMRMFGLSIGATFEVSQKGQVTQWPNHRFEPTARSPQFPIHRQRLAVSHPFR